MITGLHVLLIYTCLYACDHCFLACSPDRTGVFTLEQLIGLIREAKKMRNIRSISFVGLKTIEPGDDPFHHGDTNITPGQMAAQAARELGMTENIICPVCRPLLRGGPAELARIYELG